MGGLLLIGLLAILVFNGRSPGPLGFLGLSGACAPIEASVLAAAPGEVVLEADEMLTNLRFLTEGSLDHRTFLASEGYVAGDVRSPNPDAVLISGDTFDLVGPGNWVIVIELGRTTAGSVSIVGVEYDLNGDAYRSDDQFTVEVAESCSL